MKTYTVKKSSAAGDVVGVFRTDSHYEAAVRMALRRLGAIHGAANNVTVIRDTGAPNGSGCFQAYVPLGRGDNLSSIGPRLHVAALR